MSAYLYICAQMLSEIMNFNQDLAFPFRRFSLRTTFNVQESSKPH